VAKMKRKIKSEAKQFCYDVMLYIFVVLVPPTVYAVSFCEFNWESFTTLWENALMLWSRIVLFALLLLVFIVGILILLFKIDEAKANEQN
jgi:hypothetical protein